MINKLRQKIINTLGFSKTEANGTLVLILLILVIVIVPKIYFLKTQSGKESFREESQKLESWAKELQAVLPEPEKPPKREVAEEEKHQVPESFLFDPNTASYEALTSLGFSKKTASNIISYRKSGGSFRIKSDLDKIYGIDKERLQELSAHIDLPEEEKVEVSKPKPGEQRSKKATRKFDLNTADTLTFRQIYGIGPVLSRRIVAFREKLGGFYSPDQLYEVYGLDSSVVKTILDRSFIKSAQEMIYLNTDSASHLYHHPYIDYDLAKVIVNFKKQHGPYKSVDQVKRIKIISDSIYQKIYPYLSIDP